MMRMSRPVSRRMQSHAWLVENEERIDQRCTEAGGEIHPLKLAAAEAPCPSDPG